MKWSETWADCSRVDDGKEDSGANGQTSESNVDEHLCWNSVPINSTVRLPKTPTTNSPRILHVVSMRTVELCISDLVVWFSMSIAAGRAIEVQWTGDNQAPTNNYRQSLSTPCLTNRNIGAYSVDIFAADRPVADCIKRRRWTIVLTMVRPSSQSVLEPPGA